jgi:hypothetical protein
MIGLQLLCFILAIICFLLAAFGVSARVNLVAVGLALWLIGEKLL